MSTCLCLPRVSPLGLTGLNFSPWLVLNSSPSCLSLQGARITVSTPYCLFFFPIKLLNFELHLKTNKQTKKSGPLAQESRALTALAQDPGPYQAVHRPVTPDSRIYVVHTNSLTRTNVETHMLHTLPFGNITAISFMQSHLLYQPADNDQTS